MKSFKYMGKYESEESLPKREHPKGYVPFKEPKDMKKFAIICNLLAILILFIFAFFAIYRAISCSIDFTYIYENNKIFWLYMGCLASVLFSVPHEFLHGICFKGEVYMYQNLKKGMLFVLGIEDMSKFRFIFLSLLPNIVFGFIPFIIFMLNPSLIFFGTLGTISISMGAGDYVNVFNAITQVPKGALVYMSGIHSYWYIKEK